MDWLKKITTASQQLNYTGTFIYHHDSGGVETSRIWHINDKGKEQEKLVVLDGPLREIVRNGENVTCYLPEHKAVIIEKRMPGRFPTLLPEQLPGIADNYTVNAGGQDRVAARQCQVIDLVPKDSLRYRRQFCVDTASGLLLRARAFDAQSRLVESLAFTDMEAGARISKKLLQADYVIDATWHVDRSALDQGETQYDSGWALQNVQNDMPGFRKLVELRRMIAGHSAPIAQIVYSDGLSAISVFIEPMPASGANAAAPQAQAVNRGAINIYIQPRNDQMLTVIGEAPEETVRRVAESMAPQK